MDKQKRVDNNYKIIKIEDAFMSLNVFESFYKNDFHVVITKKDEMTNMTGFQYFSRVSGTFHINLYETNQNVSYKRLKTLRGVYDIYKNKNTLIFVMIRLFQDREPLEQQIIERKIKKRYQMR